MDDDRISSLPNDILYHILSFLPTEDAFTSSLLSKRWSSLWLSVLNLNLNDEVNGKPVSYFPNLVHTAIFKRNSDQPIKKLCLTIKQAPEIYDIEKWLNGAAERKLGHLEIQLFNIIPHKLLCCIFSLRNLVVLKLTKVLLSTFSHSDLPSLKTLHLKDVDFRQRWFYFELLNGCPILEDFEANGITLGNLLSSSPADRVRKCLPKLVRASFSNISNYPFQPFCSVQSLHFEEVKGCNDLFPIFDNLTQLELSLDYSWKFIVKVLNNCPNLQKLDLDKVSESKVLWTENDVSENWVDTNFVPRCLSLHLESCNLYNFFSGLKGELMLARYILENAKVLQTMRVWNRARAQREIKSELLSCPRASATCEIVVKNATQRTYVRKLDTTNPKREIM
ncbi:unnamed protein product [Trifolium pratense]|uniref:Uncharacterized protein n=1 Tax=Trifolium pratense TaxID=57577 RepID=A0ACB0K4G1_TRIPR|nr:unnamed protein product [Trifolium pratense]